MTEGVSATSIAALRDKLGEGLLMEARALYWLGELTPYEPLPQPEAQLRQFFSVVTPDVCAVWNTSFYTANRLGIQPDASCFVASQEELDEAEAKAVAAAAATAAAAASAAAEEEEDDQMFKTPKCKHPGTMVCVCAHNLGAVSWPLDNKYYHLKQCKWNCCGSSWDSVCTCPAPVMIDEDSKKGDGENDKSSKATSSSDSSSGGNGGDVAAPGSQLSVAAASGDIGNETATVSLSTTTTTTTEAAGAEAATMAATETETTDAM